MKRSSRDEDAMDLFLWAAGRAESEPASAAVVDFLAWRETSSRYRAIIAPRARDLMMIAVAIDRRTGRLPTPAITRLDDIRPLRRA